MFGFIAEWNRLCKSGRRHYEEHFREMILNLDQWFKDISYLQLWRPLCSAEWNHLRKFGRRHYEEYFSEIILNLDQLFRCCL